MKIFVRKRDEYLFLVSSTQRPWAIETLDEGGDEKAASNFLWREEKLT